MQIPCFSTSERRFMEMKMKVIPHNQLGVEALPAITATMQGVLEWLKAERLHKYWPIFSRLNYTTMINLTETNMDYALQCIGSAPITNGARGRILRCTLRLRERSSRLRSINETTPLEEIAKIFADIATTPISSTDNEPDGSRLVHLFNHTLNQVIGFHGPKIVQNSNLETALKIYAARPEVPKDDRTKILKFLENLTIAAREPVSPPKMTWASRRSPYSSPPSSSAFPQNCQLHKNQTGSPRGANSSRYSPSSSSSSSSSGFSSSSSSPQNYQLHKNQTGLPRGANSLNPPMSHQRIDRTSQSTVPTFCAHVGGGRPVTVTQNPRKVPETRSILLELPADLFNIPIQQEPTKEYSLANLKTMSCNDVIVKASLGAMIEPAVDVDRVWGGATNQVMLSLKGASQPNCTLV